MSLDALRGFDMMWIVGGGAIVKAVDGMNENAVTQFLTTQLTHVQWEGMVFYDLIFPLFLFIVGVSMVFSLDKAISQGQRSQAIRRVITRSILIFALGVIYYGGISKPWPNVQLGGVLHRIALCYLLGAPIYCFVQNRRGLLGISAALLIGYWAMVAFVPIPDLTLDKQHVEAIAKQIESNSPHDIAAAVPDRIRGSYEEGRNLTNYVDFLYLPGYKKQLYYINEGLLSTLPAIAYLLVGAVVGQLLKDTSVPDRQKLAWLLAGGAAAVVLGLAWGQGFPIIKRIWSSSFVLLSVGWSAILMALFYYLIDVRGWRAWCRPFVWIGCNALTIYMLNKLLGFSSLARSLAGGDLEAFLNANVTQGFGGVLVATVHLLIAILLARFLYRRGIFIRV
jgi:predicted acyltransferase